MATGALCVDSVQVISSFVGFYVWIQAVQRELPAHCLFFYPDNTRLILSRGKCCLHTLFEEKKSKGDKSQLKAVLDSRYTLKINCAFLTPRFLQVPPRVFDVSFSEV